MEWRQTAEVNIKPDIRIYKDVASGRLQLISPRHWKGNPMKYINHLAKGGTRKSSFRKEAWTPKSDKDLAAFSDQLKVSAVKIEIGSSGPLSKIPINADYGIYKRGAPRQKAGFANTNVGRELYNFGKEWDRKIYAARVRAANPTSTVS